MEKYNKYKEAYPNKTDAEIIESIAWELTDKVETIHKLLIVEQKYEEIIRVIEAAIIRQNEYAKISIEIENQFVKEGDYLEAFRERYKKTKNKHTATVLGNILNKLSK